MTQRNLAKLAQGAPNSTPAPSSGVRRRFDHTAPDGVHAVALRTAQIMTSRVAVKLGALAIVAEDTDHTEGERIAAARALLLSLAELIDPTIDALSIVRRGLPKSGVR